MRFRTDNAYIADRKAQGRGFILVAGWATIDEWLQTPPAQPGDTWRVHWHDNDAVDKQGPLAGYDIFCPRCKKLHAWTTAHNCASRRALPGGGFTCDHSGKGSCWTWSGSAEQNLLSASPSLHSDPAHGGCGFHGHLTNGELSG